MGGHVSYIEECRTLLLSSVGAKDQISEGSLINQPLKDLDCTLFFKCSFTANGYQSNIDAVVKEQPKGSGSSYFAPVRCIPGQKVTRGDRLLVAFDALLLSELNGELSPWGKIIYGSQKRIVKVKLASLLDDAKSLVKILAEQLSHKTAPALALNKHCSECGYRTKCREQAIASDDLSLLSSMKDKERKKLQDKGIFTIKQLSYTFRPRRRRRASLAAPRKYHHALKALAIREQKVHVAGQPALSIPSTPVFLDVEGIPDQEFYYLIGIRTGTEQPLLQHSFWANAKHEEGLIWKVFLTMLHGLPNPQLFYYGSYETQFLKKMNRRYSSPEESVFVQELARKSVNLLSVIYAKIYFPTYTNGLKEIAQYTGFKWSGAIKTGADVLAARRQWEMSPNPELKAGIITYNSEDCEALEVVSNFIAGLCHRMIETPTDTDLVNINNLKQADYFRKFKRNVFLLPEFEQINRASYWDYQREKIFLRSRKNISRQSRKTNSMVLKRLPINKIIEHRERSRTCPKCKARKIYKHAPMEKIVYDLKFGRTGVKRWIVLYRFHRYMCWVCKSTFNSPKRPWTSSKFGADLMRYAVYQIIELQIPQMAAMKNINELFGLNLSRTAILELKATAASYYKDTYEQTINKIIAGSLAHMDETKININGKDSYVWVLTNQEEVAYFYTETREGDSTQTLLKPFKGVLVSDFYSVYDSIDCPQQKCLIHLIRDLNDALSHEPFNAELKELCKKFAGLLRPVIETVDKWSLKARYLRKHKIPVERFFQWIDEFPFNNETTLKFKKRFSKNRWKLFTFLDHDQVPWNNNNAEHAIKALVRLRRVLSGKSSVKGIQDYLILLSVCETSKCKGINFLRFLRSGQKDIDGFKTSP